MSLQRSTLAVVLGGFLLLGSQPRSLGQALQSDVPEPRLYVKTRTVGLGRLRQGEKATATWTLENRGSVNLHITGVQGSCSCTIPRTLTPEDRLLEPNEKLVIQAIFDSTGRKGAQRRSITVSSDDPDEPELKLFLTGEVVTLMEISVKGRPATNYSLGSARPGTILPEPIELLPTEPGQALEILDIAIPDDALSVLREPLSKDDRTGELIRLSVNRGSRIGRRILSTMTIRARVAGTETTGTLRINGEIVGELSYTPLVVKQWQPIPHGSTLKPVRIKSETQAPFEILKTVTDPALDVTVTRTPGSLEYKITLTLSESARPGPLGTYLDIHTNLVSQPLIRIPVFAHVRPRIEVDPPRILLHSGGRPNASTRTVKIETAKRTPLELSAIRTERNYVVATLLPSSGESKAVKYIEITLAPEVPTGAQTDMVIIKTNVAEQPEITIPVTLIAP